MRKKHLVHNVEFLRVFYGFDLVAARQLETRVTVWLAWDADLLAQRSLW